jgi:hypothetical protein
VCIPRAVPVVARHTDLVIWYLTPR